MEGHDDDPDAPDEGDDGWITTTLNVTSSSSPPGYLVWLAG